MMNTLNWTRDVRLVEWNNRSCSLFTANPVAGLKSLRSAQRFGKKTKVVTKQKKNKEKKTHTHKRDENYNKATASCFHHHTHTAKGKDAYTHTHATRSFHSHSHSTQTHKKQNGHKTTHSHFFCQRTKRIVLLTPHPYTKLFFSFFPSLF